MLTELGSENPPHTGELNAGPVGYYVPNVEAVGGHCR